MNQRELITLPERVNGALQKSTKPTAAEKLAKINGALQKNPAKLTAVQRLAKANKAIKSKSPASKEHASKPRLVKLTKRFPKTLSFDHSSVHSAAVGGHSEG
jgi:hypothetical protein